MFDSLVIRFNISGGYTYKDTKKMIPFQYLPPPKKSPQHQPPPFLLLLSLQLLRLFLFPLQLHL